MNLIDEINKQVENQSKKTNRKRDLVAAAKTRLDKSIQELFKIRKEVNKRIISLHETLKTEGATAQNAIKQIATHCGISEDDVTTALNVCEILASEIKTPSPSTLGDYIMLEELAKKLKGNKEITLNKDALRVAATLYNVWKQGISREKVDGFINKYKNNQPQLPGM